MMMSRSFLLLDRSFRLNANGSQIIGVNGSVGSGLQAGITVVQTERC